MIQKIGAGRHYCQVTRFTVQFKKNMVTSESIASKSPNIGWSNKVVGCNKINQFNWRNFLLLVNKKKTLKKQNILYFTIQSPNII